MNTEKMWQARKYVKSILGKWNVPDYIITCVADALAKGHKEDMNSNWRMGFLLGNVEIGFISYDEALALDKKLADVIANYR